MHEKVVGFLSRECVDRKFEYLPLCPIDVQSVENDHFSGKGVAETEREENLPDSRADIHHVNVVRNVVGRAEPIDDSGPEPVVAEQTIAAPEDQHALSAECRQKVL
ncbi:MAG TPA: hypothetical protein VMG09_11415 [Bacteroidota bacterium]|nr:hypothetical protein [Bacteroidota bacterium]